MPKDVRQIEEKMEVERREYMLHRLVVDGKIQCSRCDGVGLTNWDAFVVGLGNLIGHLIGQPIQGRCHRCRGTGWIDA